MKPVTCIIAATVLTASFSLNSCKKKPSTVVDTEMSKKVLRDLPEKVFTDNLRDLSFKAGYMYRMVEAFLLLADDNNLKNAQNAWYDCRKSWEQSEAFLFGPVATKGYDPAIDSWPVNFVEIDSVLNSGSAFTDLYISNLANTLKGFHPIEYMLFGVGKSRKATDFTQRQKDYMFALTKNLWYITQDMYNSWSPSSGNYAWQLQNAGDPNSEYKTRKQAFLEIVGAMAGIVDEVGNGKIKEPFTAQDSMLEESPFASNSWTDFANNIQGAKNVYMGIYQQQGLGLHDLVTQYDKSLDLKIQQKLDAVILNLKGYTVPFGKAIFTQPVSVQATQTALEDLNTVLDGELTALIQSKVTD